MSVAAQTVPPDEIIVVDDASDCPVSASIFSDVGITTKGMILRNEQCRGANVSRNIGMRAATSEFVCFLDDDDEFFPEKIEVISQFTLANAADVIYHPAVMIYDREGIRYTSRPSSRVDFRRLLLSNAIGGTSMVCVNRSKFLEIGGFDASMPALQDHEAWLRSAKAGHCFLKVDRPLTRYHHVTGGGSISKSRAKFEDALKLITRKYGADIQQLSAPERRARERTITSMRVHRMLMQGEKFDAAALAMRGGFRLRDPSLVVAGISALFGLRTTLRLKIALEKVQDKVAATRGFGHTDR